MTAASSGDNSSLATKCMDFCHALASQGKEFKFSITIGATFSLDTREDKDKGNLTRKPPLLKG